MRFTQSLVLGPASGASSWQGLAARAAAAEDVMAAHPATAGLTPPPVVLPKHPSEHRVVMRVQVNELAQEVGFDRDAILHLLRIAGPRRYDPSSGDLVILGTRYPSREENRRWCMERLHALLLHTHSVFPSTPAPAAMTGVSSNGGFALTGPHVLRLTQ